MIQLEQVGRRLRITVGVPEDDTVLDILPTTASTGVLLLQHWLRIMSATPENVFDTAETIAEDFVELALGKPALADPDAPTAREAQQLEHFQEVWAVFNELRSEEVHEVSNAAFYWQVHNGGFHLAQTFASGETTEFAGLGEVPKAQGLLLEANGLRLLQTSPNTESENPTPSPDATPDTSTPPKSGALSKLPDSKVSRRPPAKKASSPKPPAA